MQEHRYKPSFLERMFFEYVNICGPGKTGKTDLLHALMAYFGEPVEGEEVDTDYRDAGGPDEDSGESREGDGTNRGANQGEHPVIFLDFSDCRARSYAEAIRFLKKKMSALYMDRYDLMEANNIYGYRSWEKFVAIMDGSCSEKCLSSSLLEMVHILRWHSKRDGISSRPMIFIDEAARPLLYAAAYGFYDEMKTFYDIFLDIDHYELTGGIYTTSYAPINTDVDFGLKYIHNEPVNRIPPLYEYGKSCGLAFADVKETRLWGRHRFFDTEISLQECFRRMVLDSGGTKGFSGGIKGCDDLEIVPDRKTAAILAEKREWISRSKKEAEEYQKRKAEEEKREYAAPLQDRSQIPSRFAGIRRLEAAAGDKASHDRLNAILRDLYRRYGAKITSRNVYVYMQNADFSGRRIRDAGPLLTELKKEADSAGTVCKCFIDPDDPYWGRIDVSRREKEPGYSDMALVKVYLSARNEEDVPGIFGETVRFLIHRGAHRFHAKVSLYRRNDHMCFWVAREDYFKLEKYVKKFEKSLHSPLPFTAYRKMMGVSREFYSWDSHNGVQAELICHYLRHIEKEEDIEILDLYSLYIQAWNGELPDDHYMTQHYKESNAQELLILVETLDILLGNGGFREDNLLLNGDEALWHALGSAKNWYQVEKRLQESA